MTPEERQLLAGLFDRVKDAAGGERDKEAEEFIGAAMKDAPHAGYVLSQAVLVQEEALKAAAAKIEELQEQVQDLEQQAEKAQANPSGGFLGGIGKSLFGGEQRDEPRRPAGPSSERSFGQRSSGVPSSRGSGISVPPPPGAAAGGSPWTHQRAAAGQDQAGGSGGSFLKGALGAAAGVAGGVLLANAIGGLFSGNNNPLGISGAKAAEKKDDSSSSGDDWEDSKDSGDDWEGDSGDDWEDDDDNEGDDEGDDWEDDGGDDWEE